MITFSKVDFLMTFVIWDDVNWEVETFLKLFLWCVNCKFACDRFERADKFEKSDNLKFLSNSFVKVKMIVDFTHLTFESFLIMSKMNLFILMLLFWSWELNVSLFELSFFNHLFVIKIEISCIIISWEMIWKKYWEIFWERAWIINVSDFFFSLIMMN